MAEEQIKDKQDKITLKEEHKETLIKKIISCATAVMKAAFSKGDADTVWYKKGLYYTAAAILGGVVYAFTYYGTEIIDWATTLISNLF